MMLKSNRIRTVLLAGAALLALAATLHAAPLMNAGDDGWRVVAASGPVEVLPPNAPVAGDAWVVARRGDVVPARAVVRTGKRGRTTLTRSDAIVIVSPDSRIELPSEAPSRERISSVVQTEGSVFYEIQKQEQPHFEVVTPFLVAGVKGTSFLVTVDEHGATVGVDDGLVEVADAAGSDVIDVAAGEFVSVDRGGDGIDRLDDDDRDNRRDRRREERVLATFKDARADAAAGTDDRDDDSDDDSDDDGSDRGDDDESMSSDFTVADRGDDDGSESLGDARDDESLVVDGRFEDDLSDDFSEEFSDDLSEDLIADDRSDDVFEDDDRDDDSRDEDIYTDDHDASRRDGADPDTATDDEDR